jgi:YbgC/YbaW family acyl-CoA thioester hydrolase
MLRRMNRSDFRFAERLRVRWAEVDLQRIVFNGHYLMYFDTAVAGWWRAMALPYHLTMEGLQGDLYVRKATLEYEGSARYDEQLEVAIRCARIGNSSLSLHAAVFRAGQRLAHGELVYVFADPATQTSRPVPPSLRDALLGYEAGEPALVLLESSAPPPAAGAADEEGAALLPPAGPSDDTDWHVVAQNRLGLTVARGRLRATQHGLAEIDHLVVRASLQGSGIGHGVLAALARAAVQRGAVRLQVDSPWAAVPFFAGAGFEPMATTGEADPQSAVRLQRTL